MTFICVFSTFPCGILCQVWYLIVSIPDLCRLSYFDEYRYSHFQESREFILGGGVEFYTLTKIANFHMGLVLFLHLYVQ